MKKKELTYLNKLQVYWGLPLNTKIPDELKLFMKYSEFKTSEKEEAAEFYFKFLTKNQPYKHKAKKLGLI